MQASNKLKTHLKGLKIKNELAQELGVDRETIYRWINKDNEKFAHLKVIQAVNKITGLTQDEMFEEEELPETQQPQNAN